MGSRHYRRLVAALEKWPLDATKEGRDLGAFLRAEADRLFPVDDAARADANVRAVEELANNRARNLYARGEQQAKFGATRVDFENLKSILSTQGMEHIGGLQAEESGGYVSSLATGVFKRLREEKEQEKRSDVEVKEQFVK